MRFFRRKNNGESSKPDRPICLYCGSRNTGLKVSYDGDSPDFVKAWRGQKYLIYQCYDCHRDFNINYADMPVPFESQIDEPDIDDADELRMAEEELKRRTDEEGDHRFG